MTDLELVEKTRARVKGQEAAIALKEAKAEMLMAEKIEYIVSNAQVAAR